VPVEATWPSGQAEVCKTSYGGSNPPVASSAISTQKEPAPMQKIRQFFEDVLREMGKVNWPTQKELRDSTAVVLIFSLLLSVFIFAVDEVFTLALEAILR
jgi:preprotein translocase subunit SecE